MSPQSDSSISAKVEFLKSKIGDYLNFPHEGILFRDIFTAFRDGQVCSAVKDILVDHIRKSDSNIEAVVGLDARGFLFGFLLSAEFGIPFIPIRKKGKLPGKCLSYEYTLEYGSAAVEIQAESLKPGQKVLIIDDLLATGGTLGAACELIKQAGGVIEEVIVLLELKALNGRKNIPNDNIHSIISYDD